MVLMNGKLSYQSQWTLWYNVNDDVFCEGANDVGNVDGDVGNVDGDVGNGDGDVGNVDGDVGNGDGDGEDGRQVEQLGRRSSVQKGCPGSQEILQPHSTAVQSTGIQKYRSTLTQVAEVHSSIPAAF